MQKDSLNRSFLWVVSLSVLIVILGTAYKFLLRKDYYYLIETECDPAEETCFYRDCSNPDDCPPNGLEYYKMFSVSAANVSTCSSDSCINECQLGSIECEEVVCGEEEGDECSEFSNEGVDGGEVLDGVQEMGDIQVDASTN